MVKCIECDDAVGEVFTVGTGVATTVNELAKLAATWSLSIWGRRWGYTR